MRQVQARFKGAGSGAAVPDCLHRYPTKETVLEFGGRRVVMTRIADFEELLAGIDPASFAEDERLPYWAELWPSAVALAEHLDGRVGLRGKRVLELGCGLGLASLIAALSGARVIATDYEEEALAFARHNARQNGCRGIRFRRVDWRLPHLPRRYDIILGSDVIYERRNFAPLVTLLLRYLSRGGLALFSEPRRHKITGPFFELLAARGFSHETQLIPLEWEGSNLIAIHAIRHRPSTCSG
ncbi:MAG: methyltransferase domain-containing protein [Planctomycetes bacterium]|nr:methyltransferase domain-containing protein [Planctomycetota bacterium]